MNPININYKKLFCDYCEYYIGSVEIQDCCSYD
nr:MAG TPA: SmD3, SmB (1-95), SmD1 (1-85) snRNP, Spliceosome, Pre-mRNA splicing [Bacteriophage sp.]